MLSKIGIYILMENIIPIPIVVEGFFPIIVDRNISNNNGNVYVDLYDSDGAFIKESNCNRFNGMYYLYRRGNLPSFVGVCPQNKYFCFHSETLSNDGTKRGVNFADIIAPIGAIERMKMNSCEMICAKPVRWDCFLLSVATDKRDRVMQFFKLHKVICKSIPTYEEAYIEFLLKNDAYKNDMFITSQSLFIEYVNVTTQLINGMRSERDFFELSFSLDDIAEIMINVFIIKNKIKVETCPVMNFSFKEQNFS